MADILITQSEADYLLALEKRKDNDQLHDFPDFGGTLSLPLSSSNRNEKFILDIRRRRIELKRNTFQNRARNAIIIARLDLNDRPHRNPDGQEIGPTHLHIFKEGFGDKWAIELPKEHFKDGHEPWQALQDFMRYCNIVEPPRFRLGLMTCIK